MDHRADLRKMARVTLRNAGQGNRDVESNYAVESIHIKTNMNLQTVTAR